MLSQQVVPVGAAFVAAVTKELQPEAPLEGGDGRRLRESDGADPHPATVLKGQKTGHHSTHGPGCQWHRALEFHRAIGQVAWGKG